MGYSPHLAATIDRCYATINNDPRLLLETAGGPVGRTANVVVARLYGWDEQVDHEMRLRKAEPIVFVPILERLTLATPELSLDDYRPPRAARYDLQSNFAVANLAAENAPDEAFDPTTFLVSVLCVRYKRTDRVPR